MERLIRYGWAALLAAMAGDVIVSLVLPIFYKEYNCMKMSISALGNPQSPVRIPFNIWMLIEGLLFLIAIPAIHKLYHPVSAGLTYTVIGFTILFAVGACIFTCFFSVNETKEVVTTASQIHGVGSVIGFMLFLFVPLLLAILSFKSGERSLGIACIICFIIALFFFGLFVMSDKPEFAGTIIENEGLWQRMNLVFMHLPFILVSIKQIQEK
jgi:hypothetical protein